MTFKNWIIAIAIGSFVAAYFSGLGGLAWRTSERLLPGISPITTGSIIESENSSISTQRAVPKKVPEEEPTLFDHLFGRRDRSR